MNNFNKNYNQNNNLNENKFSAEVKKLYGGAVLKIAIVLVAYTLLGFIILMTGMIVYYSLNLQEGDFIYLLAQWVQQNMQLFIVLYCIIGYFLISAYFLKKPFVYLGEVLNATESISRVGVDDRFIELPKALKQAELQLNAIKLNMKNSEQAAKIAEQRKNDLVVYLAHDLKTPLTSVIGYLTLLRDENRISEELREKYLSISLNKAERLEDLINEFFEITRFNLSSITLDMSRVNLTRMLQQLIFEFKPMLADKKLSCELFAPPDIMLKCDADKLQRVFDNLLRNAVNYSFEESVITISVLQLEGNIKLYFVNHGNTISPEKLDRIFEQFFRLDTARTTGKGGAGLGLAIAKEIVELHGGEITASSKDETITFELTLPLMP